MVGFERRDRVGGIWRYSPNLSYTSVIHGTVSNVSKFVVGGPVSRASLLLTFQSGFSDFPLPKGAPRPRSEHKRLLTSTQSTPRS